MKVLVGWTDPRWNDSEQRILEPILAAFGFQVVIMDTQSASTHAFEKSLSNEIEQSDGFILFNTHPDVKGSINDVADACFGDRRSPSA